MNDDVWLHQIYLFTRIVGDKGYAMVLIDEALADFGLSPADVPDDIDAVLEVANDLFESGKHIRRVAFRRLEGPRAPMEWENHDATV